MHPRTKRLRVYPVSERFYYFVREREHARHRKDLIGGPGPHSEDPIIATYRFCNIDRENDAVTKWVKANVRDKFAPQGKRVLVPQILAARIFNEPECLRAILPVPRGEDGMRETVKILAARKAADHKVMRGAYMMPAHGDGGKGKTVEEYYLNAVRLAWEVDWTKCTTLADVADQLVKLKGISDFLANQVCTDLRYTLHWSFEDTPDWLDFVLCGPGTRRGVDRWDGHKLGDKKFGNRKQSHYINRLLQIRDVIWSEGIASGSIDPAITTRFQDPNNLSNTFCEFDKFERALWSDGHVTLRKY